MIIKKQCHNKKAYCNTSDCLQQSINADKMEFSHLNYRDIEFLCPLKRDASFIDLFTTMPLFVILGPEYLSPISFLKSPNKDTSFQRLSYYSLGKKTFCDSAL